MKDISSHIMDIVQNSITADAAQIRVCVWADKADNTLTLRIEDDGKGMSAEMLARVTSPFTTTRTTRKVGLGIPLLKAGAENTGGTFGIDSQVGVGTKVCAVYALDHLDRPPLGDLAGVMYTLVVCNPDLDFVLDIREEQEFLFDTREIKEKLGDVPLNNPDVSAFIEEYLTDGINEVFGGKFE